MSEKIAFRMNLKPGAATEYRQRHDEIWPELKSAMQDAGVLDYTIWHDAQTDALFAIMTVSDPDRLAVMRDSDVAKRWRAFMADVLEYNDDGTPFSVPLKPMFALS